MWVEYFPPNGEAPLVFGYSPPYGLRSIGGLGSNLASPVGVQGPGQRGISLVDTSISERVIPVGIDVIAADASNETFWGLRSALQRACVVEPVPFGETPRMGLLRFHREDVDLVLELDVFPRNSPQYVREGIWDVAADLEFVAPFGYPRETEDRFFNVAGSGGFEFAPDIEHPAAGFEMPTYNVTVPVTNGGDVRTPIKVRLYGSLTDPILYNDTTGKSIRYVGSIANTEYVEIHTSYGEIYAEKVVIATGVRTNVMGNINHSLSEFWELAIGENVVRLGASVNVGGYANVYWRQRYGGV